MTTQSSLPNETICAPATAPGRAALALIRLSGPQLRDLMLQRLGKVLPDRRATLVHWKDRAGSLLDHCVATFFAGPNSYTGEDLLELTVHGNPRLVHAVLQDLHDDGIRLAAPGEFTLRAVRSGRMNLSRAESVAALIDAETDVSLQAARQVLTGGLDGAVEQLRSGLLDLSARLELEVDFAEEEAVPGGQEMLPWVQRALADLHNMLQAQERVERQARAPRVVLAGRPNAGKSSLVNALLGEDRLIVSAIPGTTRDWVEVPVSTPRGVVHVVDTAGLAPARDELDAAAQERTRSLLGVSLLRVLVAEAGRELDAEERQILSQGSGWTILRTKMDKHEGWVSPAEHLEISVRSGHGLESFRDFLAQSVHGEFDAMEGSIALLGERQRQAARAAHTDLLAVEQALKDGRIEVAAWHLRQALRFLSELVGEITPQQVLERVFSSFCIGK